VVLLVPLVQEGWGIMLKVPKIHGVSVPKYTSTPKRYAMRKEYDLVESVVGKIIIRILQLLF
jgi:hypothetical protein